MKKSFLLRLDPAVFDALQRWANDDLRSVNAQIDYVLRRALKDAGRTPRRSAVRADPPTDSADDAELR